MIKVANNKHENNLNLTINQEIQDDFFFFFAH